MARKKSKTLTDGELRIMQVVWQLETATVKQVVAALANSRRVGGIAYNTVQTMMGILADKGYLSRRKAGRAFVYTPLVSRREARGQAVRHLVGQFFGGSQLQLVHNLLEDEPVDAEQLERLRDLLDRDRSEPPAPRGGSASSETVEPAEPAEGENA